MVVNHGGYRHNKEGWRGSSSAPQAKQSPLFVSIGWNPPNSFPDLLFRLSFRPRSFTTELFSKHIDGILSQPSLVLAAISSLLFSLLLWRTLSPTFKSIFNICRPNDKMSSFFLLWNRQKYVIYFHGSLATVTLEDLKAQCKVLTGVPVVSQKLMYSGAIMNDNLATLESLGLRNGVKVKMIGTKPEGVESWETVGGDPEELALISRMTTILLKAKETIPKIEEFETLSTKHSIEDERKRLHSTYNILSEHLLQNLLSLDQIDCASKYLEARKARKESIKEVQGLLERVDTIKRAWEARAKP